MRRIIALVTILTVAAWAFAGVEASPTRLDNTRSLGMGRAYTANGLDRVGVFFYNPAAIQNVNFSKPTLFNFTISGSMDWQDIYDELDKLSDELNTGDFDVDESDTTITGANYESYNRAFDAVNTAVNRVNSLYNTNGSFFFQNLSNWTNQGLGFSFFAKAGIDLGINNSTAGSILSVNEIELINAGKVAAQYISDNAADPNNPTPAEETAAVTAGNAEMDSDATNNTHFNDTYAFPGIDLKNYVDLGVVVTKGFTKPLEKKFRDSDDFARLDYGVSAKMIWRSNLVENSNKTIDGISVGVADFTSNEDVDSRFDDIEKTRIGFDVGALLHMKDSMDTRLGVSIMDIFSTDFDSDFDAPDPQVNIGVALRPFRFAENTLMRKVDVAVDLQDITNSDKDFDQQFKLGVEGRTTSMLTWRLGYTDKNLSQGIDFRLGSLGSMTIAHYYDLIDRFGREFETENWAIQFKAMF